MSNKFLEKFGNKPQLRYGPMYFAYAETGMTQMTLYKSAICGLYGTGNSSMVKEVEKHGFLQLPEEHVLIGLEPETEVLRLA